MASRYIPKIGDVVDYKGKRMVLIKYELYSLMGDYYAYLIEEEIFKKSVPINIETEELFSKCTKLRFDLLDPPCIPFVKINNIPIEVEEISYIKIQLKE